MSRKEWNDFELYFNFHSPDLTYMHVWILVSGTEMGNYWSTTAFFERILFYVRTYGCSVHYY